MNSSQPQLTLLAGPAGSGKTGIVTEAFEEALRNSKHPLEEKLLLILPTAEHRERIIDLSLRKGLPGFFGRRVTTFDRALKHFLRLGGIDFASDVSRRMILREILGRAKFDYFEKAGKTQGFIELLSKTIVELKESLIRPDEFKRKMGELAGHFPEFRLKYEELVRIYAAYEKELETRGLVDARDALRLLEEGLKRGEYQTPQLEGVWIDGFSDFSKLQLAFIEFLTRHSDRVTITLTAEEPSNRPFLFQIVYEAQAELESMGFQTKWLPEENYRTEAKPLKHLERNVFRESVKTVAPDNSVRLFEATGISGEIEMIAREIKQISKLHSYHFSDIALIFRRTDPYLDVIRSVFNRFQIPVEFHERFRLNANPAARTLVSFFWILLEDWRREDLLNFLKSGYVKKEAPESHLLYDLELAALEKGIFKGRDYWMRTFDLPLLKRIALFESHFRAARNAREFGRVVKKLCLDFGLLQFPDSADEKTREDREAVKRIFSLLLELERKSRGKEASFELMAGEFLNLIEVDLFSVHARDKNRVQVYNVSLARQKEYKCVFIVGLLERQFPFQVREDSIFSDAERRAVNQKGTLLKERLPRQSFERYLFYMAMTRARERIYFTYPRFDLEGKEALPSFYADEVKRLFRGTMPVKHQAITEVIPDWDDLATVEEAAQRTIKEMWSVPEGKRNLRSEKLAVTFYNRLLPQTNFKQVTARLTAPIEAKIKDSRILKAFEPREGLWSPTALEAHAECPYRYFANKILLLESQDEGIDIRRRGSMLHEVLEHFFTWLRDVKKGQVSFEAAKIFCMNEFQKLWEDEPLAGERRYRLELERKRMERILIQILRLEIEEGKPPIAGLSPAHFEYRFTDLTVESEEGSMVLRGVIDRVDVDKTGTYALVIDYKTGKEFKMNTLSNGTSLQLPLYLIAIGEKLGLKPLGAHLYSLAKGSSSGFHHQIHLEEAGLSTAKRNRLSPQEFQAVLKEASRFAVGFSQTIQKAEIPVKPRDCVSYCPYDVICRIEKWRLPHIYREIREEDQKKRAANQSSHSKL